MLFSSDAVAKTINDQFEPVWVSVRDVPIVTIDFGSGHKVTRTLNGNVATYALHADGTVLDILPGIYQPKEYMKQLEQLKYLHQHVTGTVPLDRIADRLTAYHSTQAKLLADGQEPGRFEFNMLAAISKARVENPVKFVIAGRPAAKEPSTPAEVALSQFQSNAAQHNSESKAAATLRGWKELAEDTKLNETTHRHKIHGYLAKAGTTQPADVTKWLYREVLHADLDDPLLGLGEVLNKNYPFAEHDADRSSR